MNINIQPHFVYIKEKLPPFMFRWLVKKRWLYPEPQIFSIVRVLQLDNFVNSVPLVGEIKLRLFDEALATIFKEYKKFDYFPYSESIRLEKRQSIVELREEFHLTWRSHYNPYGPGPREFIDIAEKIKELGRPI